MLLGLQDPDPSIIKNSKKKHDFCCVTFYVFLSLKTDVNAPSKSKKATKIRKKLFFVCILKATDVKRGSGSGFGSLTLWSGSGSVPTCHGSTTLRDMVLKKKVM
jgi:hypothetical protein